MNKQKIKVGDLVLYNSDFSDTDYFLGIVTSIDAFYWIYIGDLGELKNIYLPAYNSELTIIEKGFNKSQP